MSHAARTGAPTTWHDVEHARWRYRLGRRVALAAADAFAFLLIDLLFRWGRRVPALVFFPGRPSIHNLQLTQIDVFLVLACLFIGARYFTGDYSRRLLFWDSARLTTRALIVTSIPDFLLLVVGGGLYSPLAITATWLALIPAIPLFRQLARVIMSSIGLWQIPCALVGDGEQTGEIYRALSNSLSLGFDLRTFISTQKKTLAETPGALDGLDYITVTDTKDIVRRVQQAGCEQAVVATEDMQSPEFAEIVQSMLEADIAVAIAPSLRRLPLAGMSTHYFFGRDILILEMRSNLRQMPRRALKRCTDLVGGTIFLVLFSPLILAIAAAIKRHDGGPVFYAHKRVGRNNEAFHCLKFRTMAVDADKRLAEWRVKNPERYEEFLKTFKLTNDPRVTGPGKWLRKTSLDELPQLINVLRGEMSLVGPRPVVQKELTDYYGTAAQLYFRVRPGMTGLWQVSGRSNTSYTERVTYDEWYILNWTLWYDLVILLQTAWAVVSGKGAF